MRTDFRGSGAFAVGTADGLSSPLGHHRLLGQRDQQHGIGDLGARSVLSPRYAAGRRGDGYVNVDVDDMVTRAPASAIPDPVHHHHHDEGPSTDQ